MTNDTNDTKDDGGFKVVTVEDKTEARRLLGDVISDAMDATGIAALVKKAIPDCGCAGRRKSLNNLHKKLLGL